MTISLLFMRCRRERLSHILCVANPGQQCKEPAGFFCIMLRFTPNVINLSKFLNVGAVKHILKSGFFLYVVKMRYAEEL